MLFITDKKAGAVGHLAVGEYENLVEAFALGGATLGERERGTAVVRKYQQQRRWFGCDCLGAGEGTPILVPVEESHIRHEPKHPDHADGCPFELDARDRLLRTCSLREQEPAHDFKLARALAQPDAGPDHKGAQTPDGHQPLAPLEAYAHPCWSATDILPLDSSHERRCLDILVRFQDWMATQGCQVALTKPLHDRSGYYLGQEAGDAVLRPGFEGTIHAAGGGFLRSFVVEVMGYDRPEYRAIKARVKAAITGKRVHYLEHLAHDPAGMEEHDRAFQSSLAQFGRRAISKARDMPARLAPPVVPGPAPAATPGTPNQSLAVSRALTQAPSSPMPESHVTSLPGQLPGPAHTVPPPAALLPGPAYPRTGAGPETPSSQRPDTGQAASSGPRRPWFPQRLLDHLRLRR